MEHVKSTIATTALLVTALVTAAHILHPRDPAFETRRGRPAVAAMTDGTTAWSDPPARAAEPVAAVARVQISRPASFTLLPAAMTANLSGTETPVQARRVRRLETAQGRKPVPFGNRARSASVGQGARAEAPAATAQPVKAAQSDPIGDLLKNLGIGRDSEG